MFNWLELVVFIAVFIAITLIFWVGIVSVIAYRIFDFLKNETPFDIVIKEKENERN